MEDVQACRSKEKARAEKTSAPKANVKQAGRKKKRETGSTDPADGNPNVNAVAKRDGPRDDGSREAIFACDDAFSPGSRYGMPGREDESDLEVPATIGDSPDWYSDYLATGPFAPAGLTAPFPLPFLAVPSIESSLPSTHELATSLAMQMQNAGQLSCCHHWPFKAGACDPCYEATKLKYAGHLPAMPDPVRFAI